MRVGDQARGAGAAEVLAGGGELGALMRALDWAATPLGPVERWPQALKTCVRIMLTSRQPMWLGWGDELTFLYNDPYRAIVGGKHPRALGQPTAVVWREIWADIAPRIQSALGGEEGTYDEALLLIMERHGYPEETYYTFSYSPIPDDDGRVAGIFCANTDNTRRVIGERQIALLRELATGTAEARSVEDACALSMRCLETNSRDVPFALLYLLDPDQRRAVLRGTANIAAGHPAAPELIALDDVSAWPIAEALRTNAPCLSFDLGSSFGALPAGAWDRPPTQAVAMPIAPSSQTGPAGILIAGLNPYRLFDDDYRGFLGLVAGQIATARAGARAYEEERRRAEALAKLDRAKTAFFSNVSHEFRTPLALALGPVQEVLAEAGDALPAPDRERLEIAHRNHLRLLKLVNTLLDFARIEAGRTHASYEPTDLATLTADLASVFRSAVERAGLRLVVDCPPLPESVYVDREMWETIVLNLLSNALKYTFEGEIAVVLRAATAGEHVALEVRDTGTGIPADELPHLFERFHRVHGARARTHEGTGIGLALVQELVRLHGGTIAVMSIVDAGTTFTVALPSGTAHLPAGRLAPPRAAHLSVTGATPYVEEALRWLPEREGNGKEPLDDAVATDGGHAAPDTMARVLLADDNADMRAYVGRLLGARYTVEAVADGAAALAAVRERLPDLILTDVMMPGLDGFGLLRELRGDPRTATLPVILLSARAGEEARVEGLEAGADDYLVKPFSARELVASVGAHVALARARALVTRLHHLTVALSAAVTSDQVADVAITHGLEVLGATVGAVWLLSADGASFTTVRTAGYAPEALAAWASFSADAPLPIADAVRAREPVILASPEERAARYPRLAGMPAATGDGALVAIPLLLGERLVGGLGLSFPTARRFDAQEHAAMRAMGELCAQAVERTRLYEAEQQAREDAEAGRRRLSEIFKQTPASIAVYTGPNHVLEFVNPVYEHLAGFSRNALIGRSIRDVFPEVAGQGIFEPLDQVFRTGLSYTATDVHVQYNRSGAGVLEEAYFTFTYEPLRDRTGAVTGVLQHAVEATVQVQARRHRDEVARQMRVERDRLQQVLDTLPAGVVIADASGRFTMSNVAATAMFGAHLPDRPIPRGEQEAYETYGACRLDGTPYPSDELPLQRALWRGEVVRGEQFLIRMAATGRDIPVLANTEPLRGPDGAITGAVGIFQDITAIRDLERTREEFLSSAAHDLKNPLTSIRGLAQLAQRRLARLNNPETAPVRDLLAHIQKSTDAMLGLINELVDVARQQTGGGLDLHRGPTDLVALVRGCIEAHRDASGRPIQLEAAMPVLRATVDAARIERVVSNLLSNALKYSLADRPITVRIWQEEGTAGLEALLAVRDEGIGIPAADQPHIFDRFQRARNVVGHIQGTGVGLASARGIVEQHGGTIAVESTEGAGTTFTVRLPLDAPASGGGGDA